jgi:hypothetical protein
MDKEVFKQFEKQFGEEWVCSCGNPFKAEWVETISRNSGSFLAKYHCNICGQEQIFAASEGLTEELLEDQTVKAATSQLTSDDVLDIKEEIAKISRGQARSLAKKKVRVKVPLSKLDSK